MSSALADRFAELLAAGFAHAHAVQLLARELDVDQATVRRCLARAGVELPQHPPSRPRFRVAWDNPNASIPRGAR